MTTRLSLRSLPTALLMLTPIVMTGCGVRPAPRQATGTVTQGMREACPTLTDEVIEGFLMAISGIRDSGLSEEDALQQWADACNNIPADGNFQGDVDACRTCLPILVQDVYADI